MSVQLRHLSPTEFSLSAATLVRVYLAAMGYPPQYYGQALLRWQRDRLNPGFDAVIAEEHGNLLAVAYGFIGNPDTTWDRQLRAAFANHGGPTDQQRAWLDSYFEVAEIHTLPAAQGRGIGRSVLQELLKGAPTRYSLLSTPEVPEENNAAFGLYRSFGFWDVLRHHIYPGDERPFAILGVELPLIW